MSFRILKKSKFGLTVFSTIVMCMCVCHASYPCYSPEFWILCLSYSLSFSRTFWDSSRRSCRALSLLESSSTVLMSSHSCLLRSCRLRPEDERELARLTPPLPPRFSQASWVLPSGALERSTDSSTSKSWQSGRQSEGREYETRMAVCWGKGAYCIFMKLKVTLLQQTKSNRIRNVITDRNDGQNNEKVAN